MDSGRAFPIAPAGAVAAAFLFFPATALAAGLAEPGIDWPSWAEVIRVLTLQDYNTRVVIVGSTLLGLAAGLIGTFLLLRKRALLSDTLSHATLPGIALAFILMALTMGEGKHLLGLIAGAAVFSIIGTGSVLLIQRYSRLKDDAALGIVLSVYFGLGIALLGIATRMETGNAAGLTSFIYGKTASMLFFDAVLIAATAFGSAVFCLLFFKEFSLVCFDADYAAAQGWPVGTLDLLMMAIVVVVTVIGLQAVGLILVVALLIIPAAAARFWTFQLGSMLWISGLFGALAGMVGSALSALMANLPAGAVIVLTASFFFVASMAFGRARGLLRLSVDRYRLRRRIRVENLLRELYEWYESAGTEAPPRGAAAPVKGPSPADLEGLRAWSPRQLQRSIRYLVREEMLWLSSDDRLRFTEKGARAAAEVVRKHRLWEAYLITHADVATGMVDLSADRIEHVLDSDIIAKLERMVPEARPEAVPSSPHELRPAKGAA